MWPRRRLEAGLAVGVLIVVLALGYTLVKPSTTIGGRAEVVDGDTLKVGGTRIRLLGLDAPELQQTCTDASGADWGCGRKARSFVVGLVANRAVTCTSPRRDAYGRALAKCSAGQGDLGAQIIGAGWAVADFDYGAEALRAQSGKLGIWSGPFVQPSEWRRTHGEAPAGFWDWIGSWFKS
jgi:endonuclease YncB( thermonuclease family)